MENRVNKIINVSSLTDLSGYNIKRIVIAIGVFDGVHCGHQLLLRKLNEMAKQNRAEPIAVTFYPHPREVIGARPAPKLLIPPEKKNALLHHYGVHAVVTIPFTREFSAMPPDEFIHNCLKVDNIELCGISVGSNWRFGADGMGNVENLKSFAVQGHFDFTAVDELAPSGEMISSTLIRRAISTGLLDKAEQMLGWRYSLSGIVEKGHNVATGELSCPTANLNLKHGIMPPDGVYVARAYFAGKEYDAAVNIGISPTYNRLSDRNRRVEVHLIGFTGELYGQPLEVELVSYLREERSYPSYMELKKQIAKDIGEVRQKLEARN
ncbi:MAG: riboflavin biosynthesis protein RibF [Victivallaceae bacterium]|nr:riboflavin biosynthesis protein RibF [Victivallaceae bacterium]